eukprot:COSAG01_NODE_54211_length_333_cov_1.641026_1_plen_72_part_10
MSTVEHVDQQAAWYGKNAATVATSTVATCTRMAGWLDHGPAGWTSLITPAAPRAGRGQLLRGCYARPTAGSL